ncbi:MAG: MoxR family ATPase [Acidobacteriota bacterium]|jgi:MoxR-like ATPase|nr:MoxR family ATPase [Acidobacteriota bacterium]
MHNGIAELVRRIATVILGKDDQIRLVVTCLLARGHLLIEDLPGMGKTTLAQAIARALGMNFSRIQFTSDLLPADIVGVSVFERDSGEFRFHPGPLFAQLVVADELNRATPRTQSALLEAMEERQVSLEGVTRQLPRPFFVIATQNQRYHVGTFPLPESQLDRFLMRLRLGYPDPPAERLLLTGENRAELVKRLEAVMSVEELIRLQDVVQAVHASAAILDYVQDILAASRSRPQQCLGLSPRAGIALLRAAQAWALSEERDMVLPEDIQHVAGSVLEHRLNPEGGRQGDDACGMWENLMRSVPLRR